MNRNLLTGSLLLGAMAAASLAQAQPAQAFSFGPSFSYVRIDNGDTNQSFTVFFDGFVSGSGNNPPVSVPELNAEAEFTLTSFNGTTALFNVLLTNTSTIDSRLSSLGFDVASSPDTTFTASASPTGDFPNVGVNTNYPVGFGTVDICFFDNPGTCTGNQNGLFAGESGSFSFALNFANSVDYFDLDRFVVRFQEISPAQNGQDSGIGVGRIPTPALLPGLLGMGVAALRKRKEEEEDAVETKKVKQAV